MLIDIEGDEGKVCQNGTLEATLDHPGAPPFPPPSPLHSPSVVPPYVAGGLNCAILAQLGVLKIPESGRAAGGERGASEEAI